MAKMYPGFGPKVNDSMSAEPTVYELLKGQLDDEYHVIHSIPWLSSFVSEFNEVKGPLGEIDFLIFHPSFGVLAIEVKGGVVRHNDEGFYYSNDKTNGKDRIDPVSQINRSIFALQNWLRTKGVQVKIGRAFFFPESEASAAELPPSVVDHVNDIPFKILLDINDSHKLAGRIREIMCYFKKRLSANNLSENDIQTTISMILPNKDYRACWYSRVNNDNKLWLRLTPEQNECIKRGIEKKRLIIGGWPGSGKTLVVVQVARKLSSADSRVLVLTFNKLLSEKITYELSSHNNAFVYTISRLCVQAAKFLGHPPPSSGDKDWFDKQAYVELSEACAKGFLDSYDALVVDEGQIVKEAAWDIFTNIFSEKKIIAAYDATQAFSYEKPLSKEKLENLLSEETFYLTNSLRMPKSVCNRLKVFNEPNYSVINPRGEEADTLLEVVSSNPKEKLREIIDQLIAENVPLKWVTVLVPGQMSVHSSIVPYGPHVETIGRYRGMESPIIIILASGSMSDTDFFCAYSRATSRCVIILDAYKVKRSRYASLGPVIYEEQKPEVEREAEKSLTDSRLGEENLSLDYVVNGMFQLAWSDKWRMYVLLAPSEVIRVLIREYLYSISSPLVCTWSKTDRHQLFCIKEEEFSYGNRLELKYCVKCEVLCPHSAEIQSVCKVCENEPQPLRDGSFEDNCKKTSNFLSDSDKFTGGEKKRASPYLGALIAIQKANINLDDERIAAVFNELSSWGSVAVGFSIFAISTRLSKDELTLKIGEVAHETQGWNNETNNLAFSKWQGFVNDGFTKLEKHGFVYTKVKGYREIKREMFESLQLIREEGVRA